MDRGSSRGSASRDMDRSAGRESNMGSNRGSNRGSSSSGNDPAKSEQIFRKSLPLSDEKGNQFTAVVQAVEYQDPYSLSILILSSDCYIRMDVAKADLSVQLQRWIEGDSVSTGALIASARLEETMEAFVKYGRPPPPSSLIMWILSRTVIFWSTDGGGGQMMFGGGTGTGSGLRSGSAASADYDYEDLDATDPPPYYSGGEEQRQRGEGEERDSAHNPYQHTVDAAVASSSRGGVDGAGVGMNTQTRPKSAPHARKSEHNDFSNTFQVTRNLLGNSNALKKLETKTVTARSSAATGFATANFTSDHYRLVSDIRKNRNIVEDDMEARRRMLEISNIRQVLLILITLCRSGYI
jgi:hypothetical protein